MDIVKHQAVVNDELPVEDPRDPRMSPLWKYFDLRVSTLPETHAAPEGTVCTDLSCDKPATIEWLQEFVAEDGSMYTAFTQACDDPKHGPEKVLDVPGTLAMQDAFVLRRADRQIRKHGRPWRPKPVAYDPEQLMAMNRTQLRQAARALGRRRNIRRFSSAVQKLRDQHALASASE